MLKTKERRQNDSNTVEWLANAIGRATRSAKFCVAGGLPVVDPGIDVNGLGVIKFPLKTSAAKKLIACCQTAPYGKGTQTLVDTRVRKTFELDPKSFRLNDAWNSAIADATRTAAEQLGLPADRLEARLYKLLVYEKSGFFLPHRDSEKHDRMVASLIVVLPHRFEGGRLIVRHGAVEEGDFPRRGGRQDTLLRRILRRL
jgi:disulfide oxidoreductase YuzD